jgi:ATP-dependent RNA/DNA helicase IGHMBP2
MDTQAHLRHIGHLLSLEQEEDILQFRENITNTPIKERRERGICWYPVKISETRSGVGETYHLIVENIRPANRNPAFQPGNAVQLFLKEGKESDSFKGVVAWVDREKMRITTQGSYLPDWLDERNIGVDLIFDAVTFQEMNRALDLVKNAKNDRLAQLRDILLGEEPPRFLRQEEHPYFRGLPYLNDSQNQAVGKVLAAQDVAIVHGPPGTGKTTTLVAAIKMALKQEKKVLVTAASNNAVDLLVEKLVKEGVKAVRIGNPARIDDEVAMHSLDEQVAKHPQAKRLKQLRRNAENYRDMAMKYKRSFGYAEREQRRLLIAESKKIKQEVAETENYLVAQVVAEAQVVAATLVGCTHPSIRQLRFSTVFIDEAAQALEPATWIPITKADRVVLAGDHCQLPPTVKSDQAARGGLKVSLFELAIPLEGASTMLDVQYRMHQQIMGFSNQSFYHGQLTAHASVATHQLPLEDTWNRQPMEFLDTAGTGFEEKELAGTTSKCNPGEAKVLLAHLDQLWEALGAANQQAAVQKIGIISPYSAQVNLLQEMAKENGGTWRAKTSINSVDGFQGRECDLIYLSLVRSNPKGEIGFLRDTRRLNVALTRAKVKLVVIGDSSTISLDSFYQGFLDYLQAIGAYRSVWELPFISL